MRSNRWSSSAGSHPYYYCALAAYRARRRGQVASELACHIFHIVLVVVDLRLLADAACFTSVVLVFVTHADMLLTTFLAAGKDSSASVMLHPICEF